MLNAKVSYRDNAGRNRKKTIKVSTSECCAVIRAFLKEAGLEPGTYVSTIKIGSTTFNWDGYCYNAFARLPF